MKKNSFINRLQAVILPMLLVLFSVTAMATPPQWAPAHGYRAKTKYIYFPEHNFYFDLNAGNYIWWSNGKWTISASLPGLYTSINLHTARQVELDYYGLHPYKLNKKHVIQYGNKQGNQPDKMKDKQPQKVKPEKKQPQNGQPKQKGPKK